MREVPARHWTRRFGHVAVAAAFFGAGMVAATTGVARADEDEDDRSWLTRKSRVRDGLAPGLSLGVGFAGSSGYPNDVKLQGKPDYYSSSDFLVGRTVTPHLMGALTDWFNFGFMLNLGTYSSAHWESTGGGAGVRFEVFPLWSRERNPARNLGLYGQGGIGWGRLHNTTGDYPDADAVQSYIGAGAFHEITVARWVSSHLALGPYAQYDLVKADAFERHALSLGLRTVWYGGR